MDTKTPAEITAEKHAQVVARAKEGYAAWKIAEETGYTLVTVRAILQRERAQTPLPGDQTHSTLRGMQQFPHDQVIALALQGKNLGEIAVLSQYSTAYLRNILRAARARGVALPAFKKGHTYGPWRQITKEETEEALRTSNTMFDASVKLRISPHQLGYLRLYHHLDFRPVRRLRGLQLDRQTLRRDAVLLLRDAGWTFEAIGTALGMSRQGAEQCWLGARNAEHVEPEKSEGVEA